MSGIYSNKSTLVTATVSVASLLTGVALATYGLRLRDRERLRQATSRIRKNLHPCQRYALGPFLLRPKKQETVLVVGAGAYGTAMAYAAAVNHHEVILFMRDAAQCECINTKGYNPKYIGEEYPLSPEGNKIRGICTQEELKSLLLQEEKNLVVILALPCQLTPKWCAAHKDWILPGTLLVSTAKGLYVETQQLIGHAILDALDRAEQPLCFLSGPGFALDIVKGDPTNVVVASDRLAQAVRIQKLLSHPRRFRVYTSQDPVGVQLGGALKNPLAVGAGMIAGMGFGINTLSAVITRASSELCDLCIAMGGEASTINGLAGIGDLMLTCFSPKSRNQQCGQRLMAGEKINEILKDMTVEGVATAHVAVAYAEMCGLDLPLFGMVHALLSEKIDPSQAVELLMGRPLKHENTPH